MVGYAVMAINAGFAVYTNFLVLLASGWPLLLWVHGFNVMAISAFGRVGFLHVFPNFFRKLQAVRFKFFFGVFCAN